MAATTMFQCFLSRQMDEPEPIITSFTFIISSGTVYEDIFRRQTKLVRRIEKMCNCKITLSQPRTSTGPLIGYHQVEVKYDLSHEGHRAFIAYLQRIGRLMRGVRGSCENYQVVNTTFL
ncbi:unnamed protein product [Echinostoma caproni]|uniref:Actin-related protein 2/3 complex subunit 4 n=1 Tax=Echinostoma caproni TaxID=27848 RepID=A0A183A816_9TREM|nr:unnamed protein product [Echinostoma caproni]